MNNKSTSVILVIATILSITAAAYQYYKMDTLQKETTEWKSKYEEALIDMEEANKRIELIREDLEKALKESEEHSKRAEDALLELQKHKGKK